ncbi:MAG TPA: protein kinase [Polyangiaceae bacterium]|nr:protein kinase [Polyangiaceae bacterium]
MSERELLTPGESLGRYELLAQVARGGMGEVWAARLKGPRGFQKLVAIKTLLPELCDDPRIEQMLLEEARIASAIQHPNVVQTTELGEHRGALYLVMEWIDGESLSFVLKRAEERAPLPIPVAVNLVAQACRGLHAAHELKSDLGVPLGVVHRDVSPHNVLVTHDGVVKLVDFGIAKAMNQDQSLTDHGEVKGKYAYMAPEQVTGADVDRRADIFALGITLYIATTGVHPFKRGDKASVVRAITNDEPPELPSSVVPGFPPRLEAVLMKALQKPSDQRYATAEALRVALEAAVPEAFAPRFELAIGEYLKNIMGDRAVARREALRRFQLAADERRLSLVSTGVPPTPSQSAGSLRAIIVDQGAAGPQPLEFDPLPRASQAPTAPGVRQRSRRGPVVFAALSVALAVSAFAATRAGLRLPHLGVAASPVTPAPTLAAPPPRVETPSPPALGSASAPVAPTGTEAAGLDAGTPHAAPTASAAPGEHADTTTRLKARPKPKPPSSPAHELMAPDYAK